MAKHKSYLACVTGQKSGERIIRVAGSIAAEGFAAAVVSVMNQKPGEAEIEALDFLHGVAREVGLEMTVLTSGNPALSVAEFIARKKITHVITGTPKPPKGGFVDLVRSVQPKVRIITIPEVNAAEEDSDEAAAEIKYSKSPSFLLPVSMM